MKSTFSSIDKGETSACCRPEEIIVRDQETWRGVWSRHTADEEPSRPLPSVNFDSGMVVAIFAGEKPTTGYSIEIDSIESRGDELVVTLSRSQPRASAMDLVTCPFHIVRTGRKEAQRLVLVTT